MLREQTYKVGDLTLNCAVGTGTGPPLLLLHGVTSRWQSWLPIAPSLALRWHLHALDLRGHGGSGRATGAYRINDYATDVVALLRRQIGSPTVLVGHSLGAIIAAAAAALAPELVRASAPSIRRSWRCAIWRARVWGATSSAPPCRPGDRSWTPPQYMPGRRRSVASIPTY